FKALVGQLEGHFVNGLRTWAETPQDIRDGAVLLRRLFAQIVTSPAANHLSEPFRWFGGRALGLELNYEQFVGIKFPDGEATVSCMADELSRVATEQFALICEDQKAESVKGMTPVSIKIIIKRNTEYGPAEL